MATSVITAFNEFLRDKVNLDPDVTRTARSSLEWLLEQIHGFPDAESTFPHLYTEKDISFGSFARRTKIRELDDVDVIIGLFAGGATYADLGERVQITVPATHPTLNNYLHDGTTLLNSKRVINAFVAQVASVAQYRKAEIKRTGEAATLSLTSYTWTFDIVPAFFTNPEPDLRTFYLIPDGDGHWRKTDPRLDRDAAQNANQRHDAHMLDFLRLMKYWNVRRTAPAVPSYVFETMIIRYCNGIDNKLSEFVDMNVADFLDWLSVAIYNPVYDLKNIQGDLNSIEWMEKLRLATRATADAVVAREGGKLENSGDQQGSMNRWRKVFGDEFPAYG